MTRNKSKQKCNLWLYTRQYVHHRRHRHPNKSHNILCENVNEQSTAYGEELTAISSSTIRVLHSISVHHRSRSTATSRKLPVSATHCKDQHVSKIKMTKFKFGWTNILTSPTQMLSHSSKHWIQETMRINATILIHVQRISSFLPQPCR